LHLIFGQGMTNGKFMVCESSENGGRFCFITNLVLHKAITFLLSAIVRTHKPLFAVSKINKQ